MSPAIFVVSTPIGNLNDVSQRCTQTLDAVDIIAAEDTRRARQLLNHLGIQKKEVISYYDEVEEEKSSWLCERLLREEKTLALISDAGTPCISDPGYRLIKAAHDRGIAVHPVPGASSLTALVSCSGLPSDRFLFVGFLPNKKQALLDEIKSWRAAAHTIVFYSATRRLAKTLKAIAGVYAQAKVCVGRELTKIHEEIFTLPVDRAIEFVESHETLKGEATVVVYVPKDKAALSTESKENLVEMLEKDMAGGATFKDLLAIYKDSGLSRSELYQMMLDIKHKDS